MEKPDRESGLSLRKLIAGYCRTLAHMEYGSDSHNRSTLKLRLAEVWAMDFWERIKRSLDWLERIKTLVEILLSLGLGAALKALLATRIPSIPSIW
jgi:hypothetical protein